MQAPTQAGKTIETGLKNRPALDSIAPLPAEPNADTRFIERTEALARVNQTLRGEIVERKRIEQALRESEEKFRAIVETTSEWIWAIDRQGLHIYSNPTVEAILGYAPEELLGRSCLDYLHELDRQQFEYMLRIFMQDGWGWKNLVLRWRHKDGTYRYLERNGTPILGASGEVMGYRGTDRDITERKRVEQTLGEERASLAKRVEERTAELSAANAELAKAAKLKDEFLASMSHELRTPLNAILGLSESLQEQIYGELNPKQLRSLRSIEESGRHLLSLLNDILDLSKVEAGKIQLYVDSVSIGSVCQASVRLIKEIAQKKQLKINTAFDKQVSTVRADERRLKQILVNLLGNAVKFTPIGGQIGLEVVLQETQKAICFIVWDTGIGIAPENLPRLFQPFVQLDSRLSRQFGGTGLGLVLVRRMVEMHGGSVTVESVPGKGSRFTVSLPWMEEGIAAALPDSGPVMPACAPQTKNGEERIISGTIGSDPKLPGPLILLAEDNEINIETMGDYLKAKGYRLTIARSGGEAVERAQSDKPDLILMDIQMPQVDGLEATRRIRSAETPASTKVPIVALTALAMPGDRERCLAAGVDEYLSKPVNFKALLSAIEMHCAKNQPTL